MNSVSLTGRLCAEPELRKTQSNKSVLSFTLGVADRFNKDHTDFINCIAWNQSAEFLSQYAHKGDLIGVSGRLSQRTYDGKNGKVYIVEVTCESVELLQKKAEPKKAEITMNEVKEEANIFFDEELPF